MAAADIINLRPRDKTSGAIGAAIERATAARAEAQGVVRVAQEERDSALLDADAQSLDALERKLTTARANAVAAAERIEAVVHQLEARLVATKREEAEARVSEAREAAEAAGLDLAAWWDKSRPKLAEILREGERLDALDGLAQGTFTRVITNVRMSYPDMDVTQPKPTGEDASFWRDLVEAMSRPLPPPLPQADPADLKRDAERVEMRRVSEETYRRQNNYSPIPAHRV